MKTTAALAVILSAATALAGTIKVSPQVIRALEKGNRDQCPGGRDFNFCVPFLNWTCPPGQGQPGSGLPQPNSGCVTQNNLICACWCTCSKEQCAGVLLPLPKYC